MRKSKKHQYLTFPAIFKVDSLHEICGAIELDHNIFNFSLKPIFLARGNAHGPKSPFKCSHHGLVIVCHFNNNAGSFLRSDWLSTIFSEDQRKINEHSEAMKRLL